MTDQIETIREALNSAIAAYDGVCRDVGCKSYYEALAALSEIEGDVLPPIPKYWHVTVWQPTEPGEPWAARLADNDGNEIHAEGPTLRAAVLAAKEKVSL